MKFTTLWFIAMISAVVAIHIPAPPLNIARALVARQGFPYPPICAGDCYALNRTLSTCTDAECLCTNTTARNLQKCLNCSIEATTGEVSAASEAAHALVDECAQRGVSLSPIVLEGTSSTTTISAAAVTGSQTESVASITGGTVTNTGVSSITMPTVIVQSITPTAGTTSTPAAGGLGSGSGTTMKTPGVLLGVMIVLGVSFSYYI